MELFDEYEKYLFCEAGIRGGYCCASERYAKANIPGTTDYDENNDPSYLFYIDANNLYGHAMSRPLPLNQFRWLDQQEIANLDVLAIPEEGDDGYFLEVDLKYPENLYNEHNEVPFCLEPLKTITNKNAPQKLIGTLHNKKNYIVHYRYLQSALQNGLKLMRIHRGIKFHQAKWLALYISLNNQMRTMATDEFLSLIHISEPTRPY